MPGLELYAKYFPRWLKIKINQSASKVGYAAIILNSTSIHSQISGRLPGYSSPYDAEAFALMEALLFINNEVHTHDQICIFSDSRSNLQNLTQRGRKSELAKSIQTLALEISQ